VPSPVHWPDPTSAPLGFERVCWGMAAGDLPDIARGSCFGAPVAISYTFELERLVLVRLAGPIGLPPDSLGSQAFAQSDEGYYTRDQDGTRMVVDVLDQVVLLMEIDD